MRGYVVVWGESYLGRTHSWVADGSQALVFRTRRQAQRWTTTRAIGFWLGTVDGDDNPGRPRIISAKAAGVTS